MASQQLAVGHAAAGRIAISAAEGEVIEAECFKQKPTVGTWPTRYARIEGRSLNFYTNRTEQKPRGSSIADVGGCTVHIGEKGQRFLITLERRGVMGHRDLDDKGFSRFCFTSVQDRNRFSDALRRLSAEEGEPPTGGARGAGRAGSWSYAGPDCKCKWMYGDAGWEKTRRLAEANPARWEASELDQVQKQLRQLEEQGCPRPINVQIVGDSHVYRLESVREAAQFVEDVAQSCEYVLQRCAARNELEDAECEWSFQTGDRGSQEPGPVGAIVDELQASTKRGRCEPVNIQIKGHSVQRTFGSPQYAAQWLQQLLVASGQHATRLAEYEKQQAELRRQEEEAKAAALKDKRAAEAVRQSNDAAALLLSQEEQRNTTARLRDAEMRKQIAADKERIAEETRIAKEAEQQRATHEAAAVKAQLASVEQVRQQTLLEQQKVQEESAALREQQKLAADREERAKQKKLFEEQQRKTREMELEAQHSWEWERETEDGWEPFEADDSYCLSEQYMCMYVEHLRRLTAGDKVAPGRSFKALDLSARLKAARQRGNSGAGGLSRLAKWRSRSELEVAAQSGPEPEPEPEPEPPAQPSMREILWVKGEVNLHTFRATYTVHPAAELPQVLQHGGPASGRLKFAPGYQPKLGEPVSVGRWGCVDLSHAHRDRAGQLLHVTWLDNGAEEQLPFTADLRGLDPSARGAGVVFDTRSPEPPSDPVAIRGFRVGQNGAREEELPPIPDAGLLRSSAARKCLSCEDEFGEGVECLAGHYQCIRCTVKQVQSQIVDQDRFNKIGGMIMCPACLTSSYGKSDAPERAYDDEDLHSRLPREISHALQQAVTVAMATSVKASVQERARKEMKAYEELKAVEVKSAEERAARFYGKQVADHGSYSLWEHEQGTPVHLQVKQLLESTWSKVEQYKLDMESPISVQEIRNPTLQARYDQYRSKLNVSLSCAVYC